MTRKQFIPIIIIVLVVLSISCAIVYLFQLGYSANHCTKEDVVITKNDILGTWKFGGNAEYSLGRISFTPLNFVLTGLVSEDSAFYGTWDFNSESYTLSLNFTDKKFDSVLEKLLKEDDVNNHSQGIDVAAGRANFNVYFNKDKCTKEGLTFFIDSAEYTQIL